MMSPLCLLFILAIHISGGDGACMATCEMAVNSALSDPDQNITGTVTLKQESSSDNITIMISLSGFNSSDSVTNHGFHVHQLNDLSNGCNSLSGHYNPMSFNHSSPTSAERHVGDLGNVVEDGSGNVMVNITDSVVSLYGDYSVLDRSFVVHADEDDLGLGGDLGSVSTGNAGSRLACCIITATSGDCSSATYLHYNLIMTSLLVLSSILYMLIPNEQ